MIVIMVCASVVAVINCADAQTITLRSADIIILFIELHGVL